MLRTDLTDHRGTDDARLLSALSNGDAIALAEAYHRTIAAAHACARRLLASPVEIEALLRAVYSDLWEEPPTDAALEGWVRARCFNLGAGYLRQRNLRAPSPSLAAFTSGVEADPSRVAGDPLEQIISELTDQQRAALVRAHDQGIRTAEQDDPEAGWSLLHALLVLASPLTDDERHAAEMCSSGVALANWIFGLLPPHEASTVPGTAAEPTPCGRLAQVLRRARRRFEPLPPTPDLGHRVLASVLANGASRRQAQGGSDSLESDLRVAFAGVGRPEPASNEPPSSLDMTVPSAIPPRSEVDQPGGYPRENGRRRPSTWAPEQQDMTTPLRAGGPPPALAASSGPAAHGNAALAPATPAPPDPDERVSEDLVRMPLRRPGGRPTLPPDDSGPVHDRDHDTGQHTGDPTILHPPRRGEPDDATIPPSGLRRRGEPDDATMPPSGLRRRGEPDDATIPPGGLRARGGFDDQATARSPLSPDERRGLRDHDVADSPLRRPAPQRPGDTGQPGAPPPRGLEPGPRPPVRRDDSVPRFEDIFGDDLGMSSDPASTTTAAMPAMRRGDSGPQTPPPTANRPPVTGPPVAQAPGGPAHTGPGGRQAPGGPAPSAGGSAFAGPAPGGPMPMTSPMLEDEEDEEGSGGGVLRWVIVLVLIALGAAFGIWLGQMLIS